MSKFEVLISILDENTGIFTYIYGILRAILITVFPHSISTRKMNKNHSTIFPLAKIDIYIFVKTNGSFI